MASSYPGSLDSFTNPSSTDAMDASAALYHDVQHANINDAVEAVQAELGTDPAGNAATVKARLEYVDQFMGRPLSWWASGSYAANYLSNTAAATYTHAADRIVYVPWWCGQAVTLDRVAVEVSTQQAGANARLGIYSAATTGGPGALLLDGGEIDCSTAAVKELTVSQALAGGALYWLAILNETAGVIYRAISTSGAASVGMVEATSVTVGRVVVYESATFTSGFPANASAWSGMTVGAVNAPIFWLRRT